MESTSEDLQARLSEFNAELSGSKEDLVNCLVHYVELKDSLITLSNNELQSRLAKFGAKKSGVKIELVYRLIAYID